MNLNENANVQNLDDDDNNKVLMDNHNDNININKRKEIKYGCIHCGQYLFNGSSMIQRQIEIDENTSGCLVSYLYNDNDITMGPKICKTFLNGMFNVKEIFCDGCLNCFGWKIIESFDEWNSIKINKYCIDITNIKQISSQNN